jgi:integrase
VRFHLYRSAEVCELMKAALQIHSRDKLRPACMHFLIGLLYCSGLRIDEALSLKRTDVDLVNQRLFIQKGKFGKQRYVPLANSVVQKIEEWYKCCNQYIYLHGNPHLFIDQAGQKLKYSQVNYAFLVCRKQCGLLHGLKPPRLHDFRHTYACNCILKWQKTDDVNTKLPILATVMGHINIESTQLYLHISNAQLQQASAKFHEFYTSTKGDI